MHCDNIVSYSFDFYLMKIFFHTLNNDDLIFSHFESINYFHYFLNKNYFVFSFAVLQDAINTTLKEVHLEDSDLKVCFLSLRTSFFTIIPQNCQYLK